MIEETREINKESKGMVNMPSMSIIISQKGTRRILSMSNTHTNVIGSDQDVIVSCTSTFICNAYE